MPEQPLPTPGRVDVEPFVRATFNQMLTERTRKGVETYGRPLQTFNGRDALRDAAEELVDAIQYVHQAALEAADLKVDLANAKAKIRALETLNDDLTRRLDDLTELNQRLADARPRERPASGRRRA